VYRHNSTHGLSPLGNAYGILGSNVWFAYSWYLDRPAGWWANVSFTIASSLIGIQLIRHKSMKPIMLFGAFAIAGAVVLPVHQINVEAVGWAAIILSVTGTAPQFIHVIRTHNLHGISVLSYSILVTSCVSWMSYGFMLHDPIYWYPQLIFVPANSYILFKAASWHRKHSEVAHDHEHVPGLFN
jgi:uncharacterized protein with PQ loop repeat